MNTLMDDFNDWLIEHNVIDRYNFHAQKVAAPTPREALYWPDILLDYSDANAWAEDLIAEAEDFEIKAMAAATESLTVAQARGACSDYIRWARALRRLAESSKNRTMTIQSKIK